MRVIKILAVLLMVGGVTLATHQVVSRMRAQSREQVETKPKIRVVSATPRDETGRYNLGQVTLLNNGQSWAAGYDGQRTDMLFHSRDLGRTWQSAKVAETGYNTRSVMFADAENGWAVGVQGLAVRTKNGGKSWESLNIPTKAELNAVRFFDSRIGYVAGYTRLRKNENKFDDEVTDSVEIHCTEDGGATWRQCYKEDGPSEVHQIVAPSEAEAFVVLDGTRLIRTDDQGRTWQDVPVSGNHLASIAFASERVLWVVGRKGIFQSTSDHGKTWDKPSPLNRGLTEKDWNAIAFNRDGIGLAVGEDGALAITIDNGKTWELSESIKSDDLRGVQLQGTDAIVLGAQKLYSLNLSEAMSQSSSLK